ncbi:MAG TPA: serine/threonine-protein kinase [Pseudomonadota bacterium]|nr:serine/threonine-protein kinase [Pseudomonadota bacterium]
MNTSTSSLDLPTGSQVLSPPPLSRYVLQGELGRGAMATVFRAWDRCRQQPCAIKLMRPGHPQAEELGRRFLAEARIVADIDHPNVVRLHDSGVMPDGAAYLAMELLEGRDLHQYLSARGPLTVAQAIAITSQVGSALAAIHRRGVVHRDIKPQNILLCAAGSDDADHLQAKVIDFGLAKILRGDASEHSDGMLIGTLEYLAPEATLGISALVDTRADQWALAVVAYRMLSGVLPFPLGSDPIAGLVRIRSAALRPLRELRPDLPAAIEEAITRALSKDKELRFPQIELFIETLNSALQEDSATQVTGAGIPQGREVQRDGCEHEQTLRLATSQLWPAGMDRSQPSQDPPRISGAMPHRPTLLPPRRALFRVGWPRPAAAAALLVLLASLRLLLLPASIAARPIHARAVPVAAAAGTSSRSSRSSALPLPEGGPSDSRRAVSALRRRAVLPTGHAASRASHSAHQVGSARKQKKRTLPLRAPSV